MWNILFTNRASDSLFWIAGHYQNAVLIQQYGDNQQFIVEKDLNISQKNDVLSMYNLAVYLYDVTILIYIAFDKE